MISFYKASQYVPSDWSIDPRIRKTTYLHRSFLSSYQLFLLALNIVDLFWTKFKIFWEKSNLNGWFFTFYRAYFKLFSRFVGNFTVGTNIPIMKAAKELQTFKNIAEKKLPDKDIEEFH